MDEIEANFLVTTLKELIEKVTKKREYSMK